MLLDFILGIKAGIGRTFNEAEIAMFQAKELAEGITDDDSLETAKEKVDLMVRSKRYAIHLYDGTEVRPVMEDLSLSSRKALENEVEETILSLNRIEKEYGFNSLAYKTINQMVRLRSVDQTTGTLTYYGYLLQLKKGPERAAAVNGSQLFQVLVDCNYMHYWNSKVGYNNVTDKITVVGNALVQSTRTPPFLNLGQQNKTGTGQDKRQKRKSDRYPDLVTLVTRTHGSAGDEFLIDLYCPADLIVPVVNRVFDTVYSKQGAKRQR